MCKTTEDSSKRVKFAMKKLDGGTTNKCLDFVVAEAFVPNPHNYTSLEHIDGNIANNNASNLQ